MSAVTIQAGVVFFDDFEAGANPYGGTTPDVSTYTEANTSGQANTTLWVRATSGYGASRNGLIDDLGTDLGNFVDPVGQQAYAFRYTNSGVTTAAGKLGGGIALDTTYTVSFDAVLDGYNSGTAYAAYLVLFDDGAARNAVEQAEKNTAAVLAQKTGNVTNDGNYYTFSFNYTTGNNVIDNNGAASGTGTSWLASLLGKDLALRFKGATTVANIDNVQVSAASAYANAYWDGGDTGGTWDNEVANTVWDDQADLLGTNSAWASDTTAMFGSTVTSLDVVGTVNAGSMNFAGSTTVSDGGSGELALARDAAISVASGATTEIGVALTGSQTLYSTGPGTLVLTGANSYSGGTYITGGTLQVGDGTTTGTLGDSSGAVINNATLAFNVSDNPSIGNAISGSGAVNVNANAGTLTLSGSNNISGTVTVSSGTLSLTGATNTIASLNASSGAAIFNGSGAQSVGIIAGSIQQSGSGALSLTGNNSGSTATVTVDNGTTLNVGGNLGSGVGVTNDGTVNFNTASTIAVVGAISGTGGVTQSGAGTTTLTSALNDYSGATAVNAGTLVVDGGGVINGTSGVSVAGGTFTYSSSAALSQTVTVTSGTVNVGSGLTVSQIDVSGGTVNMAGTAGVINATGGILEASGATTTGLLTVNGGTIELGDGVIASMTATGGVTVGASGAVLNWDYNASTGDQILGDLDATGGTLTINATGLEAVEYGTWTVVTGTVTGFTNIVVNGAGNWLVSEGSLVLTLIPEPSTMVLAGLGLAGLTLRRRRK
ncbi:MAG: autotransporter-associated beta strand repeat-containing protein [Lentisphaeria bacterium]|nr:autotransporter-associated beta strand repeat-containing protein [Lentisphaeria bacterium]